MSQANNLITVPLIYTHGNKLGNTCNNATTNFGTVYIILCKHYEKVQVGKDQEKAQSAKIPTPKTEVGKKNKLIIRHLYHENIS